MRDGDQAPVSLGLDREQLRAVLSDPVLARELSQPVKCLPQKGEEICGTGRRTCLISPYGDLFPCGVHPIPAGNLREKSFYEIWTGSPLLKDLRTKTVDDLRGGARRDIGGFRCSALALIENGDFLGPFRRGEEMAELHAEVHGRQGSAPA
jgi:MoaA/NifB/PqqE/SkfB family radical SAM enzyme